MPILLPMGGNTSLARPTMRAWAVFLLHCRLSTFLILRRANRRLPLVAFNQPPSFIAAQVVFLVFLYLVFFIMET